MKKTSWIVMTVLALCIAAVSFIQYIVIGAEESSFVQGKLEDMKLSDLWFGALFVHAAASIAALAVGPFALSSKLRTRRIGLHRLLGRIYMAAIALGGITGLYLAFYATGGIVSTAGFLGLSAMWLTVSGLALYRIKSKQLTAHRQWMIRSYALTLAAVTLRIYIPISIVSFGEAYFETSYMAIAWLCWIPNLIIAELYIRKHPLPEGTQGAKTRHQSI